MKQSRPVSLAALLTLSALTGCASGASDNAPFFCPQVAILQQASVVTTFLPGRSDVGAQVTTAAITGVAGACASQPKEAMQAVTFQVGFLADNGPANHGNPLQLPYFVAITQNDKIISKTDYTITLNFNGNASTAQATSKTVKVVLANAPESRQVQILVGFELSPAQLSYAESHPNAAP